jgi:hypothetical protein
MVPHLHLPKAARWKSESGPLTGLEHSSQRVSAYWGGVVPRFATPHEGWAVVAC